MREDVCAFGLLGVGEAGVGPCLRASVGMCGCLYYVDLSVCGALARYVCACYMYVWGCLRVRVCVCVRAVGT